MNPEDPQCAGVIYIMAWCHVMKSEGRLNSIQLVAITCSILTQKQVALNRARYVMGHNPSSFT